MRISTLYAMCGLFLGMAAIASADLVAHYEFEGDARDSSGNALDGTFVGTAGTVLDEDRGMVLDLRGGGSAVDCGNSPLFDATGEITLAAWVNFETIPALWTGIITKGDTAWRLSTVFNQPRFHFAFTHAPTGFHFIHGDLQIAPRQWHHLCATYDGTQLHLYVDGFEDSQSPVPYEGPIGTNLASVWIGGNSEIVDREFDGMLDDVRIYNHALRPEEVAALAHRSGGDGDWVVAGHNMYAGVLDNVGIGTVNPEHKLDVAGPANLNKDRLGVALRVNGAEALWYDGTYFSWGFGADNNYFADSVSIGRTDPGAYKLYVNGTAFAAGAFLSSDARLKQNVQTIASPMETIQGLRGVSFEWNAPAQEAADLPAGRHFGVIAQEVEGVLPEIVQTGPGGDKAVAYTELVPILLEAVKNQQAQIEELRQRIETLAGPSR